VAKLIRPKDTNELAKRIVDIAIGDVEYTDPNAGKDGAAVELGRKIFKAFFGELLRAVLFIALSKRRQIIIFYKRIQ
jgi:hypothetical protein